LERLSAALITARTPEQVTKIVTRRAVEVLEAQIGLVNLLSDDRRSLKLVAVTNAGSEQLRLLPPLPLTDNTPSALALATGQPYWFASMAELIAQFPHFTDSPPRLHGEALAVLPLREGGESAGVLIFGFAEQRTFSPPDRWFMQTLAHHCTLALARARHYERERDARAAAEVAHERLEFLAAASSVLSTTLDFEKTMRRAAELIVPKLADWCVIDLLGDGELTRSLVARIDPEQTGTLRYSVLPLPVDRFVRDIFEQAIEQRRALVFSDALPDGVTGLGECADEQQQLAACESATRIVIPLIVSGRPLGMLTLIATDPCRRYGPHDVAIAEDLAYRIALALDNSRQFRAMSEAERHMRWQAERLQLLSEVSRRLAEMTTDLRAGLCPIVARVGDALGEGCMVFQVTQSGAALEPVASWFRSADFSARMTTHIQRVTFPIGSGLQGSVAATGEPVFIPSLAELADREPLPPWWPLLADYGAYSALVAPLRRDRVLGTMVLLRGARRPPHTREEFLIVQDIADRVALAIDNCDLHAQRQDLVQKLITSQEDERRHVAYEIHDSLAQVAVAAHQHLQAYASRHRPHSPKGQQALDRVTGLVRQTVDEARQVIANMRPLILDDFGLGVALRAQITMLEEAGWHVTYLENLGDERLPALLETILFRVAQESLNNARKHGDTTLIRVEIERQPGEVRLLVQDWGRGFTIEQTEARVGPGERIGLIGMRERLALVEGRLQIDSQVGSGTRIIATVPLSE
jgi:signal transduction histidine kinase